MRKAYIPILSPSLSVLKSYFGRSNLSYRVRNSFAFHYSGDALSEHWEEVAEGDELQIVLGGTIGNNIYFAAETVANAALLRIVRIPYFCAPDEENG